MADSSIRESQLSACPLEAAGGFQFDLEEIRELGEMTTNYSQAEQATKIFATSVLFFAQGLGWFGFDSPGGIFTLR